MKRLIASKGKTSILVILFVGEISWVVFARTEKYQPKDGLLTS